MSGEIWFDPTSDKLVLRDGEHYLEVPHWAREIIGNEFERVERETRQLKTENAKLRELLAELYQCSRQVGCDHCGDGYRRMCSVLNHLTKTNTQTDSNE